MNCTKDQIVNLNKPIGPSSFDMVRKVRNILGVKKAGHIGTLDPMAEGVLPICLEGSTRIIQFLTTLPKVYTAGMMLGVVTETQDATGTVVETGDASRVREEDIRSALKSFEGKQEQIPPMFSAKKKNGIPLYKLARNGITVERKPVPIHIHSIEFIKKEGNRVLFQVQCAAGTYIRTLCHDLGRKLGCGAHMYQLVRDRVGNFDLQSSLTPEELQTAYVNGTLSQRLFPLEDALEFLPEIRVKKECLRYVANGVSLSKSFMETYPREIRLGMKFRVCNGDRRLVAIVEPVVDGEEFAKLEPGETAFKLKRVLI